LCRKAADKILGEVTTIKVSLSDALTGEIDHRDKVTKE
jgi:hypothetical protein